LPPKRSEHPLGNPDDDTRALLDGHTLDPEGSSDAPAPIRYVGDHEPLALPTEAAGPHPSWSGGPFQAIGAGPVRIIIPTQQRVARRPAHQHALAGTAKALLARLAAARGDFTLCFSEGTVPQDIRRSTPSRALGGCALHAIGLAHLRAGDHTNALRLEQLNRLTSDNCPGPPSRQSELRWPAAKRIEAMLADHHIDATFGVDAWRDGHDPARTE
jgi:hypothetical protein